VKVDGHWNVHQVLRSSIRRVPANEYGLADDGSSFADNLAATSTIRCSPDLTPFTTAMKLSLALLEKNMVACGFYFIGLPCTIWKSFELRVSLWRAHELNLKIFGSEQPLVSGNKPWEGEDSASRDIADYFLIQRSTPVFSATKFWMYARYSEQKFCRIECLANRPCPAEQIVRTLTHPKV
jgi:hypothetical protein